MVKTYIRAPNWSTAPPPTGPVKLGHLLSSLDSFSPVNKDEIFPIPNENPVDVKQGCTLRFDRAYDGELGIFAQFLALSGVGVNACVRHGEEKTTELSFDTFETISFNPDDRYIEDSLNLQSVTSFVERNNHKKPLYLVTGLKIGRNGSMNTSQSANIGGSADIGITATPIPLEVGPRIAFNSSTSNSISYARSTDFIFAFQVNKIRYRKGRFTHEVYKHKAEYHGVADKAETGDDSDNIRLETSQNISVTDFRDCVELWEEIGPQYGDPDDTLWATPME